MDRINDDRLIIGVTGPVGSGVTTVTEILEKHGFHRLSLSREIKNVLREQAGIPGESTLNETTLPGFRKRLQDLGNERRKEDAAHWIKAALSADPGDTDLVIDGIRNLKEAQHLRQMHHKTFVVAAYASPDERWKRVQSAYDGNLKQFELDDARDSGEGVPWGQQVSRCVEDADFVFVNEEHLLSGALTDQIWKRIEPDLRLMRFKDGGVGGHIVLRSPTPDEGHMAAAYAEAHISQCLKRHVGAVIVGEDGMPLSLGFNENPRGMKPCVSEWGTCFKDDLMHDELSNRRDFPCPDCGKIVPKLSEPWFCPHCNISIKRRLYPGRNMHLCTAIHAEERAILSLDGRSARGGTIFTTTFPCFQCSRKIVDQSLARVVYVEAYPIKEARSFLARNGVVIEPFRGFKAKAFNLVFRQVE